MRNYILSIGIMTGNSIDGADLVLTYFDTQGRIRDLCSYHEPFGLDIYQPIRALQQWVAKEKGNMHQVTANFQTTYKNEVIDFEGLHELFISCISLAVQNLVKKAKNDVKLCAEFNLDKIDVIGFHGQTCDHCPPSRIGSKKLDSIYTVQVGNGQRLADLTGITVIYDFRSDDLMAGGEAAPLAPMHNKHLSETAKAMGKFPITFCNGGNTGNLAHITKKNNSEELITIGWDTGPFNHFPDLLMRHFKNESCDWDGKYGKNGTINKELLKTLFDKSAQMVSGKNYLLQKPPKSGDPNYYKLASLIESATNNFEDSLRTCEYFSAYTFFHSLSLTPDDIQLPHNFAVFGGGWNNPIILNHFKGLLNGDWHNNPVLPEHLKDFKKIHNRINKSSNGSPLFLAPSIVFGFDGEVMEARIFADMAKCRLTGEAFSNFETTGAKTPSVGGIIRYPQKNNLNATKAFRSWLEHFKTATLTLDDPLKFDSRWSRASAGWHHLLKANG